MLPDKHSESETPETDPAITSAANPKNPFREDAPEPANDPEADAAAEQQRKEALTERD